MTAGLTVGVGVVVDAGVGVVGAGGVGTGPIDAPLTVAALRSTEFGAT